MQFGKTITLLMILSNLLACTDYTQKVEPVPAFTVPSAAMRRPNYTPAPPAPPAHLASVPVYNPSTTPSTLAAVPIYTPTYTPSTTPNVPPSTPANTPPNTPYAPPGTPPTTPLTTPSITTAAPPATPAPAPQTASYPITVARINPYQVLPASAAEELAFGRAEKVVYGSVPFSGGSSYTIYTYDAQNISGPWGSGYRYRWLVQQGVSFP